VTWEAEQRRQPLSSWIRYHSPTGRIGCQGQSIEQPSSEPDRVKFTVGHLQQFPGGLLIFDIPRSAKE
jgi:hypothetical protein